MSLFGGLNQGGITNSSSQAGSLFGGLNSRPPASSTGGGLFGSLGSTATSQQQPQGGVPASSQSKPSSLFGGSLGGSTLAGSGGFGASTQPSGGGLFGGGTTLGSNSQTQQPSGGLFGTTQPQGSASVSTSQAAGQQSQQSGQNHAYFDSILEKSRKRMYDDTAGEGLPQLQLGLGDLRQRMRSLGPGAPDRSVDGKAHYLLAASGVDPGAAVRDLNLFSAATGKAERVPAQQAADTDVEGYLANIQTQNTLSMISDGLARSTRDFDAFLEDNVTMEWDAQRKRIYQHFGIKPREGAPTHGRSTFRTSSSESSAGFGRSKRSKAAALASSRASGVGGMSSFGRSSLQKSAIGAASSVGNPSQQIFADVEKKLEADGVTATPPADRFQREKQLRYAEKVQELNLVRLEKRCYPICHEFAKVVDQVGEQHGPDLVKAYKALIEIVSEPEAIEPPSDPIAVKERQFATAYLDETPSEAKNIEVKKRILRGGARCLENLAFEEMESVLNKNAREANVGGIPNVINKLKAYVRLLALKKRLVGDNTDLQMLGNDYVWALVYYLLRTGHIQEIVEYVTANAVAFRAIDRNFASYITDYCNSPDRRLRRDLQDRITSEYNQRLRIAPENSIDPYRMACYKVIGRCDLKSRNLEGINHTVEDFVWLQLALAREINRVDEIANEVYGLADLQKTMKEIGSRFFLKGGAEVGCSFGTFVFFQVACGMFEEAVSYLYPYSYGDAVHLAIAADYYGLLRVSDPNASGEDLLSYTTREKPQINFGRMIGYYTRDFRAANVSAAVDYLVLLCLNQDLPGQAGTNQITLCHEALRELVLESKDFALLLGDLRGDGQRVMGLIEERMRLIGLSQTDDLVRTITMQAASAADDNGRTTDAVLLYHLAEEYDNVLVILNRAMSESLAVPLGQDTLRLEPLKPHPNPSSEQVKKGSLSLSSVDDPVVLARSMAVYYGANKIYLDRIKPDNKHACSVLVSIADIRKLAEQGNWSLVLEGISAVDILPLEARGDASVIRRYAGKFSSLLQPVANIVPNLLMWSILAANQLRESLMSSQYSANDGARQMMIQDMKQKNMDMTTFTSQLRYRFPAHLHEALARAQSE
ncbi:Uncharacterized protein BP5553_02624 [Venustampulla echinocandica]|uniref:Nucleoporin NIC96 n=1 Tax=Venustampulla echinocandica TaxID=2656787 RepID=A0A370TS05_9HELO|nr:Uncharacterized protein BP5553_02624 [Venustampulla echinocandica]RDL38284.1 Uncharacterized protein BP5553_02624 [Venustampulla echinocandica]